MTQFARKMTEILNHGALNLALALGYRNRIFDWMDELGRPATLAEIASATGLQERYLREWMGIMLCGGIVELVPSETGPDRYLLPAEHADVLTRRAASDNLGVYAQEIPLLTSCALDAVDGDMRIGAGVPFSNYPDFQRFMAELSDAKLEKELLDTFLPAVDQGRLLPRLREGIRVCDLGCGYGVAVNLMAQAFPRSRFTGIDNHVQAIDQARDQASRLELGNADFTVLDAAALSADPAWADRFEYVLAFDAIHDQSHPLEALKGVRYMLAPGGLFTMVDIKAGSNLADNRDHPLGPFLYTVSLMHCLPVGLNDQGRGLGMMWGQEQALTLLAEAGFEDVTVQDMKHDPFNLYYLCRVPS
ncbi:MAG: class I SAM-dependent methyltransferase [Desulfohalobiaceae bacterium]|nr:class I SAM-dependent methyltransferase [Desulfohalobiaceae bacterium]